MPLPHESCDHQPRHHPRFCLECGAPQLMDVDFYRNDQTLEDIGYSIRLSIHSLNTWVNHLLLLLAPPSSRISTPSVEILEMLRRDAYRIPGHHYLLRSVNIRKTIHSFSWGRIAYLIARVDGLLRVAEGYSNPHWRQSQDQNVREYGKAREILFQLKIRITNEVINQHMDELGRIDRPEDADIPIRVGISASREFHLDIDLKRCERLTVRYSKISRWREIYALLETELPSPLCDPQPHCLVRVKKFDPATRPKDAELKKLRAAAGE